MAGRTITAMAQWSGTLRLPSRAVTSAIPAPPSSENPYLAIQKLVQQRLQDWTSRPAAAFAQEHPYIRLSTTSTARELQALLYHLQSPLISPLLQFTALFDTSLVDKDIPHDPALAFGFYVRQMPVRKAQLVRIYNHFTDKGYDASKIWSWVAHAQHLAADSSIYSKYVGQYCNGRMAWDRYVEDFTRPHAFLKLFLEAVNSLMPEVMDNAQIYVPPEASISLAIAAGSGSVHWQRRADERERVIACLVQTRC